MNVGRVTAIAMPLCVLAVEMAMLTWERMIGAPLDPMYTLAKQTGGFIMLLLFQLLSCLALVFRYRAPSATLASQLILTLVLSFWHADSILLVQLVAAFYAFMRTAGERRMYIGSLVTTLTVTLATFMARQPVPRRMARPHPPARPRRRDRPGTPRHGPSQERHGRRRPGTPARADRRQAA